MCNKRGFRLFDILSAMIIIIVAGFFLYSCAIPYEFPTYQAHKTFVESNIRNLKVGMKSEEFITLFGRPHKTYNATFGEDVGEAWTGEVWLYFTKIDTKYQYVKRYKKNMFVFYASDGKRLLNHWTIEK